MPFNLIKTPLVIVLLIATLSLTKAAQSQVVVIEALATATKKVIRAIDLKVQRLQNKTIDLQNVQKQIENALAKTRLDEIAQWTQKQKELYQQYFDELWRVKNVIAYYKRVEDVVARQKRLINEYKRAYRLVQQDKHFTADEIDHIYAVYTGIISASLESLDQLLLVVQSFKVQMSDAARLEIINHAADQIEANANDLTAFTNQNIQVSRQRAKDAADLNTIKQLYGID